MTKNEALKLALEALETGGWNKTTAAITALREALAQPEQEPVAWRNAALRVGEDLCSVGPFGYYDMTAEQWLDWALSVVTVHAPPPHRKPLTSEEYSILAEKYIGADGLDCVDYGRAVARHYGIKE